MKKKVLIVFAVISFSLLFSGCSKKSQLKNNDSLIVQIQLKQIVFDMACYAITKDSQNANISSFYYPKSFENLIKRHCIVNGRIFYIIETIYPDMQGIIDSSGFYDSAADADTWVDQLLIRVEEERIAEELRLMEENMEMGEEFPQENYEEEIEKVFSDEIQVQEFTDKNEVLKFMEYDKEIFIPQKTAEGYLIIHSSGEKTTRNFYNENYQITTKENWNISGASSATLLQTENFFYDEEQKRVIRKTVTRQNTETEFVYNDENLVEESFTYNIYKDKKYLVSKSKYAYTQDKKISETSSVVYSYNAEYTKQKDSFSKKYIYFYNEDEEIPPDFEYYEEGKLKMKNKYSLEKGYYTSQIFFEEDLSVKTYYEENIRVKDVYTKGDEVIRVKNYDN